MSKVIFSIINFLYHFTGGRIGGRRNKQIKVTAEVAEPEKKRVLWTQLLQVAPFYAGYQQRTSRDIPMVILHPVGGRE